MSRQTAVRSQASRSHPEDALGKPQHTKDSQRPEPAHQYSGDRTSLDPCESITLTPKRKPAPANIRPHKQVGQERDSLGEKQIARLRRK